MKIRKLSAKNFRNIATQELTFSENANIIYGDNGQGKTNLIEAMWLFTGAKSFRGSKDKELISFKTEKAELTLDFFSGDRDQTAFLEIQSRRRAMLNEISLKTPSELAGHFCAVVFSPVHLTLIKNGPQEKRKFIDTSICQMKPKYIHVLHQYMRVLDQRNRLLKDTQNTKTLYETLDIWDMHLCSFAAVLIKTRHTFLEKLKPFAREVYAGISREKEILDFTYSTTLNCTPNANIKEIERELLESLNSHREEDKRQRVSCYGPHRDDIDITLGGLSARSFASQGQQRSCVLALKLAECELLRETVGEYPVVLLDDVMSELDSSRREYLLNHLRGRQIIMTCCDEEYFKTLGAGKAIKIQNGQVISTQDYRY